MRDVRYKYHGALGPSEWRHSSLVEFLFALPYVFFGPFTQVIPPFHILNDLLASGKREAGMSGGCEWKPFMIAEHEYHELVEELLTMPRLCFVEDPEIADSRDLADWERKVLAKYRRGQRNRDSRRGGE